MRRPTLMLAALLLGSATMAPWSPASAATVQCGDVLTADTTLTADLTCGPGDDALEIGADGVTLNLAGHTISGPGAYSTLYAGVRVAQRSGVSITNGTITGFQSGVVLDEATASAVSKLTVHHNDQGINLAGGGQHVIEKNAVYGNGRDGIRLGLSAHNTIAKNTVTDNDYGIGVADGSTHNLVEKNDLDGNTYFGVALYSGSPLNTVEKNDVAHTAEHGISVSADSPNAAVAKNSVSTSGLDGIHVQGALTTITKNTAVDNGNLGIFAAPSSVDGGGNKASGNGNPAQCVGVACK
jgi:nitrous oxidase accessory protein NosD